MRRIFTSEWKRAISPVVLIAIIGVAFCICFDSWNDLINAMSGDGSGWCVYYFISNSAFGGMCGKYILPVFATLPFAASFCEERTTKSVAVIVVREGRCRYGTVKFAVNILVGGLVTALGTLMVILLLHTKIPIWSDYGPLASSSATPFHKWTAYHQPVFYCLTEVALGGLRGMIWAGASMLVSLIITDRLVITMFPFLGNYFVVRVCQILSIEENWRLDTILTGRTVVVNSGITILIAAAVSAVLVFLMGCVFTGRMVRGLKNGMFYESK